MAANIEDSDSLIKWWREQLEGNTDWSSLPKESRKQLLAKLQQCVSALLHLHVSKDEILRLIQLTDVPTVFEACISMLALPDLEYKSKHQALAYLTRVVLNSQLGQFKQEPTWHSEPPQKGKKGKIATLDYAKKYDPYNFNVRVCKFCDGKIKVDNVTGICTKCQKKGRNGS